MAFPSRGSSTFCYTFWYDFLSFHYTFWHDFLSFRYTFPIKRPNKNNFFGAGPFLYHFAPFIENQGESAARMKIENIGNFAEISNVLGRMPRDSTPHRQIQEPRFKKCKSTVGLFTGCSCTV